MTVHSKPNAIGIDKQILRWQNRIDGCFPVDIDVYGKLYVNDKNLHAYIADGEYAEIFLDDTKNAVIGFLVSETRNGFNMIKCNVKVICSCNLSAIYGSGTREDEKALLTVLGVIKKNTLIKNEIDIKTKFEDVFSDVSIERLKFRNMHPWFNFSISFDLVYKNEI
jgi:hypothetical protein